VDRKKRESKELAILFPLLFGNTVFPNFFFLYDVLSFRYYYKIMKQIFLVLKTSFSILKISEFYPPIPFPKGEAPPFHTK
jgi:hypothetical protein